jgi:hypothetical protein
MSSYHSTPAQRVPAWKRLGLKLKGPTSGESPTASPGSAIANPPTNRPNALSSSGAGVKSSPASALKRKLPNNAQSLNPASAQTPSKRIRTEEQTPGSRKSVAFAEGTKGPAAADEAKKSKPKKKKAKKSTSDAPQKPDTNLEPSLVYLRQWNTDRASWKFNKNHQTLLIKYLFDADKFPSADIPVFYQYIRDLKGFIRTRLRETAEEIRKKDMEQDAAGFPATVKDKEDKQKAYDELLVRFVQQQRERNGSSSSTNGNGKRTFDEVELAIRTANPEVKARLLKRIRAEMVVEELSDSESTTSTNTTTTSSSSGLSEKEVAPPPSLPAAKRTESQQPAKRRRLRNVRTDISDDESSSESESSDAESESSGSNSSSEDEGGSGDSSDDEDMEGVPNREDTSSSSSSSSSSSGSDSESGEGDGESGSGSSDSEDDD